MAVTAAKRPRKPAELAGVFTAAGGWFNPETDAEKLARVQSQIRYWADPANGEDAEHAYWNLRAWEIFLAELESKP